MLLYLSPLHLANSCIALKDSATSLFPYAEAKKKKKEFGFVVTEI